MADAGTTPVELEASPKSALHENIEKKGANSYYYAHKYTSAETIKTTLNEAPRLISKQDAAVAPTLQVPVKAVTRYRFGDETEKVLVYLDVPGAKELPADAVAVEHTTESVTVRVTTPSAVLVLRLNPLHAEITGASAKASKKTDRVIVTLHKKDAFAWWELTKGSGSRLGGGMDD